MRTKCGIEITVCPAVFGLPFFGAGAARAPGDLGEWVGGDEPTDFRDCRDCLSIGSSNRQSIPCCFFSCAKFSLRASRSSLDLIIFSGWWYSTTLSVLAGNPTTPWTKMRVRHTDEVAVLEVEAVELVAGLLCIHHVFVDDERSALGVVGNALSHLAVQKQSQSSARYKVGFVATVVMLTELGQTCRRARRAPQALRCSCTTTVSEARRQWEKRYPKGATNLRFFTNKALSMTKTVSIDPF